MPGNHAFLRSETTVAWLSQFDPSDQNDASAILSAMRLVSRDTFAERLRELILQRAADGGRPVGLYVEREVRRQAGKPDPLFQETSTNVRRAHGGGPEPVQSLRAHARDVGSEGIVAQLVSELCRQRPGQLLDHPGPDAIRKMKVRRFFLLTDFIGSGQRARTYLDAAWRVRSVRSWWSARRAKGMSFEVVAFAGTTNGRANVEDHPSAARVSVATVARPLSLPSEVNDVMRSGNSVCATIRSEKTQSSPSAIEAAAR